MARQLRGSRPTRGRRAAPRAIRSASVSGLAAAGTAPFGAPLYLSSVRAEQRRAPELRRAARERAGRARRLGARSRRHAARPARRRGQTGRAPRDRRVLDVPLAAAATFSVPERRVPDAARSLLVQNLLLTWRYSLGNPYEEFSFPEASTSLRCMAEWGLTGVARAILVTSLTRRPTPYPNWKKGERLLGAAVHYRLFRDRASRPRDACSASIRRGLRPQVRRAIAACSRPSATRPTSPTRSTAFIRRLSPGRGCARWRPRRDGPPALAAGCRARAAGSRRGFAGRRGIGAAPCGRLALRSGPPARRRAAVRLGDGGAPRQLLEPRHALRPCLGLLRARQPGGAGIFRYTLLHGSRLLGLVRARVQALRARASFPPRDGPGLRNQPRPVSRRQRRRRPARPRLYGQLAAAMTPGTFVAGEAAASRRSGEPLPLDVPAAERREQRDVPETLRLMLVHERRGPAASPRPRARLRDAEGVAAAGQADRRRGAPTSFGLLSYSITGRAPSVEADPHSPARAAALESPAAAARGSQVAP